MKLLFYFLLILTSIASGICQEKICRQVVIHGRLELNAVEKNLVCGDKKLEAYKNIPAYEASFFLKGFLQARGHLQPRFEKKDEILHVYLGRKSYVKNIKVVSEDKKEKQFVREEITRLFRKRLLNVELLNSIEAEAKSIVRQRGYPCAKVKSHVNANNDTVTILLDQLDYYPFGEIDIESIQGLKENALQRYYPFESEDAFNENLLLLTEKRMLRSEVVQGTYFLESCEEDDFSLSQRFIVGPPRTIRFGAGASTELGPLARIRWSNNRFGPMASLLSANLQASFRSQSLNLSADSFLWETNPRQSLLSQFEILRESQIDYEQLIIKARPHMKWTTDKGGHFHSYAIGPSYEAGTYHSKRNIDTKSYSTGTLEGIFRWTSHSYELFDIHPQEGDEMNFNFDFRHPSFGFSDQLLKLDSSLVKLSRLTNFGRGTLIGGIRFNAGTTWVNDEVTARSLPPTVKFFGGGSDDLRGFLLRTLPRNDGVGALSRIGTKLELRRTYLFKESIEGFAFTDLAYFGNRSWSIESPLFYSPGIGLRWLSPIGLVQGFAARALSANPSQDHGNLFYAGIGGVF